MTTAERLTIIAENQEKVYNAGYEKGKEESGGNTPDFWDIYQQNGTRTSYQYAFATSFWTDEIFNPKYDIRVVGSANQMFANSTMSGDLAAKLEAQGVELDVSQATNCVGLFSNCKEITHLPRIDFSGCTATFANTAFQNCSKLHTIDVVVFNPNMTGASSMFNTCPALTEIRVEGEIRISLNFSATKVLSADSIRSIIGHLSTSATGQTLTISRTAAASLLDSGEFNTLTQELDNWEFVFSA